ncbi:MAG: response regulator transcription factor [Pseudomonadota bacterium]
MTLRILVVDDQALVRRGFAMVLGNEPDIDVVAEAANGQEAIAAATQHRPDVILMDIRMPEMDGLEATAQILADGCENIRIIILTTFDPDEYVYRALRAGASGFVLKDIPPESLVAAVRTVADGGAMLDPTVTRRLIGRFANELGAEQDYATRLDRLTDRERDVLKSLADGKNNQEIGDSLHIGVATVKSHVSSVLSKLGLRDRAQAVVFAYECGLAKVGGRDVGF